MGFKDTLNTTTDEHSPLQADPKVQPSLPELFLCSIWPSHEYSATDNIKHTSKHHISISLSASLCEEIQWHINKNAADQFTKHEGCNEYQRDVRTAKNYELI
jgi:hypothetical protein